MTAAQRGRLIVVSGPSGAGKTTVLKRLLERAPVPLVTSVSATTRAPRSGEQDGVDYHFLSRDEFARRRAAGEFLECAEVFGRGDWYGTLRSEVTPRLDAGNWVLLEIDVQGMASVVEQHPDAVTIFVEPESLEELERRLRGRGTDSAESIERRLNVARSELSAAHRYRHRVKNIDVDRTVDELCRVLSETQES